ncbi:MAG: class I SAM-dependent methyltransferase [Pseudomonadota bacterium]
MAQPNHLQKFYDDRVNALSDDDFLSHVGHTEQGKPISREHFLLMVEHVADSLELEPNDIVLELCCGNGLFADVLSERVNKYVGIDFSPGLIQVAEAHHRKQNSHYLVGDVTDLSKSEALGGYKFTKVFMNASLQHFRPSFCGYLLDQVLPFLSSDGRILLSCIPRRGRERVLFGTVKKRLQRAYLKATKKDIFGDWWSFKDIQNPAQSRGLEAQEAEIPAELFFSQYRFSVLLHR